MKPYPWSCSACGTANAAEASACARCLCPSRATYRQIEQHRHALLERGEALEPAAATLAPPIDPALAWRCALLPLGLVLGFWPFSADPKERRR